MPNTCKLLPNLATLLLVLNPISLGWRIHNWSLKEYFPWKIMLCSFWTLWLVEIFWVANHSTPRNFTREILFILRPLDIKYAKNKAILDYDTIRLELIWLHFLQCNKPQNCPFASLHCRSRLVLVWTSLYQGMLCCT